MLIIEKIKINPNFFSDEHTDLSILELMKGILSEFLNARFRCQVEFCDCLHWHIQGSNDKFPFSVFFEDDDQVTMNINAVETYEINSLMEESLCHVYEMVENYHGNS